MSLSSLKGGIFLKIRRTTIEDIDQVLKIYDMARTFQRDSLNLLQWRDGYPSRNQLQEDIARGGSYVMVDNNDIVGTFYLQDGPDQTYIALKDAWENIDEIVTIHRMAVKYSGRGVGKNMMAWIIDHHNHVMIDTHDQNIAMKSLVNSFGFEYIGIVQVEDGSNRNTYDFRQ